MSAYKKIEVAIKDRELLLAALADPELGLVIGRDYTVGNNLTIRSSFNDTAQADVVIHKSVFQRKYNEYYAADLGFVFDNAGCQVVMNDYSNAGAQDLVNKITQRYSYQAVVREARKRGYQVQQITGADNTIRLKLVSL